MSFRLSSVPWLTILNLMCDKGMYLREHRAITAEGCVPRARSQAGTMPVFSICSLGSGSCTTGPSSEETDSSPVLKNSKTF